MENPKSKIQNPNKFQIGHWNLVIGICLVIFISGCGRTVTEKIPFGDQITFNLNFRGDIDLAGNKYFIVISSQEAFQIPFLPYEFIEPGIPPADPSTILELYKYYGTWGGYTVVDSGTIYLVKGPFISSGESYARSQVGGITEVNKKLTVSFSLERLFPGSPPPVIYFDFVSVDTSRFLKDHLSPPSQYISAYKNMIVTGSDEADFRIDKSLDILDWVVTIQ
ncbi:MAG: hypothetical protein NT030_03165 [Candidatus Saganbacteria bacterium]|nr:hypothetical protein [Candidatus Saganbacteria bacterium]